MVKSLGGSAARTPKGSELGPAGLGQPIDLGVPVAPAVVEIGVLRIGDPRVAGELHGCLTGHFSARPRVAPR